MEKIETIFEESAHDYVDEALSTSESSSTPTTEKKSLRFKIAIIFFLLLALLGITIAAAFFWISSAIDEMHRLDVDMNTFSHDSEIQTDESAGTNFLLIGSDSRISHGTNSWQKGAQRSDVIMLAQLSKDGQHLTVISIPRDTAVVIPGYENNKETKINHAFSYGGIPLLVTTIERNTGIRIDHVAVIDFQSFVGLTDTVGGVTLSSESEGTKTYNGKEALAFVRERKNLPRGDFDRVRRQQAWMAAVFDKVLSRGVLDNPATFKALYDDIIPYVSLDNSFDTTTALSFARSIVSLQKSSIQFATVPTADSGLNADGNWLTHFNPTYFGPMCEAFQKGEAWAYVDAHPEAFDRLGSRPIA